MQTETANRLIKIYCPTHAHQFETEENAKLVCEIDEHSLSLNFPGGEFWEYCCDCQTFFPSNLNNGKSASLKCPVCERTAKKRFLCSNCKIAGFSSDQSERETVYLISSETGIEPSCPGCQTRFEKKNLSTHDCKKASAVFITAYEKCPFCEKNLKSTTASSQTTKENFKNCVKCKTQIEADSIFCGNCGTALKDAKQQRDESFYKAQTRRLGSLCPRCYAPIVPNSFFCGKCGQAVKETAPSTAQTAPLPPPSATVHTSQVNNPPSTTVENPSTQFNTSTIDLSPVVSSTNSGKKIIYGIVAVGAFLFVIVLVAAINQSGKQSTNTNLNTSTTSSKDSRINRTGNLTTNLNLRDSPNSTAYILATHYENAKIKVLDVETFSSSADWYRIKVLEYGTDIKTGNGQGKNNPNAADGFGWMQGADEGWVNSKFVRLD